LDTDVTARPTIFLLPGRDKRVRGGGPWAYSNEVRMDAEAKAMPPGTTVDLVRVDGKPLGSATFNPHALIALRLFSRGPGVAYDRNFLAARLRAALALRERLFAEPFCRLVHAEADGLPGTIVDRYGDTIVCQLNTAGAVLHANALTEALDAVLAPRTILMSGDPRALALENAAFETRFAKGALAGPVELREGEVRYLADPGGGQKTGWFYDQRMNRAAVAKLAHGGRVLDLYCYSGGFAIAAAAAGAAQVVGVDSSEPALALAAQAAALNGVAGICEWRRTDVFKALEDLAAANRRFDIVISDPPAFAKSRKDVNAAKRGYRKLAGLAARLVAPGGFLFAASCSYHVDVPSFTAEAAAGISGTGREARILWTAGAASDHPVHPHLPETAYLTALLLNLD
jgi:23S rRNA (cytosine1962-C5)-methyltransferase